MPVAQPGEIKITLQGAQYIVPLTSSATSFYVKAGESGDPIQIPLEVAAKLYGAQIAFQRASSFFANDYASQVINTWDNLISSVALIQTLEGVNELLGNATGLVLGNIISPISIGLAKANFISWAANLTSSSVFLDSRSAIMLAYSAIGLKDAAQLLQRSATDFDSLRQTFESGGAVDFDLIQATLNNGVTAVNAGGVMARSAESTVDLDAGLASDISAFATGFVNSMISVLDITNLWQVKAYKYVNMANDIQDIWGYFETLQSTFHSEVWRFPPLTKVGLHEIASSLIGNSSIDPNLSENNFLISQNSQGGSFFYVESAVVQNSATPINLDLSYFEANSGVNASPSLSGYEVHFAGGSFSANNVASVTIYGSEFADSIAGTPGNDSIFGGRGDDTLSGGGGHDSIFAGAGNDAITVGGGMDYVLGGEGIDTITIDFSWLASNIAGAPDNQSNSDAYYSGNLTQYYSIGSGSLATVSFAQIEHVTIRTGYGNDTITTGSGNDRIETGDGHDTLNGGAGNDHLDGGAGNDTIIGGSGNDTASYASSLASVTVNLSLVGSQDTIGAGVDQISEMENLVGSIFGDFLTGNSLANTLTGNGGIDTLSGMAGNDRLEVSAAGSGSNVAGGTEADKLVVSGTVSLGTISGMEAIELAAGAALTLTGTQVSSGFALTTAVTGTGSLIINMTAGQLLGTKFWTIAPGITVTINGTSGTDIMKLGNVVQTVSGGDGTDQIKGGSAVDTINGGAGIDKIMGLGGADILTGGAGNDVFRYLAQSDSGLGAAADRITDFAIGQDRLNFVQIDADAATTGDQAFAFIGTGAFTSAGTGQIRYQDSGADLLVLVDVNGDGAADMSVILQGLAGQVLGAGQFVL